MYGYQALEFLPADDLQTRISVAITLASALRFQGKLEEANQVLTKAALLGRKVGNLSDYDSLNLCDGCFAIYPGAASPSCGDTPKRDTERPKKSMLTVKLTPWR